MIPRCTCQKDKRYSVSLSKCTRITQHQILTIPRTPGEILEEVCSKEMKATSHENGKQKAFGNVVNGNVVRTPESIVSRCASLPPAAPSFFSDPFFKSVTICSKRRVDDSNWPMRPDTDSIMCTRSTIYFCMVCSTAATVAASVLLPRSCRPGDDSTNDPRSCRPGDDSTNDGIGRCCREGCTDPPKATSHHTSAS